ncbi:MAG: single-stranded DNA-specific DHH superfamily exonuclease [Candidatus Woesearchaeota archaeon]|jgi:single-stranded DNA-specific DHH superfamily exonuclease
MDIKKAQEFLTTTKRLYALYDDDVDGLTSYAQLFHLTKCEGTVVKSSPRVNQDYADVVERHKAQKLVILDKPIVEEEFFDAIRIPTLWVDHHEKQEHPDYVQYVNPQTDDPKDNRCTAYWMYKIAQQHLWLAAIGSISDWQLNDITQEFAKNNPTWLSESVTNPPQALFDEPIGHVIQVLGFNLKGQTSLVKKSIEHILQIESIETFNDDSNTHVQFLKRRAVPMVEKYKQIRDLILKKKDDDVILYVYDDQTMSFTADLANEVLYRTKKVVIIARKKSGEYKCSIRGPFAIRDALTKALVGIDGYGGGHENACGGCIQEHDFDRFFATFCDLVKDLS